jgi:hypothetical protein
MIELAGAYLIIGGVCGLLMNFGDWLKSDRKICWTTDEFGNCR